MGRILPRAPVSGSSRRRLARWLVGSPLSDIERDLVLETLAYTHGNRTVSADLLGISVRTLRNKISVYSAEGFHIPHHESRGKNAETTVPASGHPKDKAAAMPVALASMRRLAASDCGLRPAQNCDASSAVPNGPITVR